MHYVFLQVSNSGDVLYVLPSNFKQVIAAKSWLLRAEPFLQKVRDAAAYLVRVTFGTALITSVILVWVTIVAILSGSGRDSDDRRYVCSQIVCSGWTQQPEQDASSHCWQGCVARSMTAESCAYVSCRTYCTFRKDAHKGMHAVFSSLCFSALLWLP